MLNLGPRSLPSPATHARIRTTSRSGHSLRARSVCTAANWRRFRCILVLSQPLVISGMEWRSLRLGDHHQLSSDPWQLSSNKERRLKQTFSGKPAGLKTTFQARGRCKIPMNPWISDLLLNSLLSGHDSVGEEKLDMCLCPGHRSRVFLNMVGFSNPRKPISPPLLSAGILPAPARPSQPPPWSTPPPSSLFSDASFTPPCSPPFPPPRADASSLPTPPPMQNKTQKSETSAKLTTALRPHS